MPSGQDWLLAFAAVGTSYYLYTKKNRLPYPPGPKGSPLIGNINDIHYDYPHETYMQWAKQYGEMMYMGGIGQHFVVLNSPEATREILERRSLRTALRRKQVFYNIALDWQWAFIQLEGEAHREHRSLAQKYFVGHPASWKHIQIDVVKEFVQLLLSTPQDFFAHCNTFTASVVLQLGYGHTYQADTDWLETEKRRDEIHKVWYILVDTFPFLLSYPEWAPFSFQRVAKEFRQANLTYREVPFQHTKKQMAEGTAKASFVSTLLEDLPEDPKQAAHIAQVIRDCAGSMYGAGADTTAITLHTFFLAMTLYPEVQKRARAEVDAVVGSSRLPTFEDRAHMPYLEAILMELLRWGCLLPLGITPHVNEVDEVYKGHLIPAGTMIATNIWAMFRDSELFPDPDRFEPARFLGPGCEEACRVVSSNAFGWGRRICPGRAVAEASLVIAMSHVLLLFDISLAKDEAGNEVQPEQLWALGEMRRLGKFDCTVACRSNQARELIEALAHA